MIEKVGNLDLEVVAIIEVEGKDFKVVNVPSPDEYRGFPPSWEFVKSNMLSWRPYFKGRMIEFNGQLVPAVNDYLLNLDEEMYKFLYDIYLTFKVNKPSIETNISVVITKEIDDMEREKGRTLSEMERTNLYLRFSVEAAIFKDVGIIN
ncbi:hypothetical protein GWK48_01005 [Metallosphaera tengchongensis]|uniref:Uncharacterized protein n=1 Tax=Metallosphaera tengchongensis TaxID=1532350 RepID=A0A6N0NTJ9_9CREN|nr:hypothetical protein [Metallosphaera tengchongensis]QKQ99158.1 hypothetical protein GWK48_01005 [Metallosphaera tengchongensis]